MTDSSANLPAQHEAVLAALLAQPTIQTAAKQAKVSEATVYRCLRDDEFKTRYRKARTEIVEHAIVQLQRDAATATKTLRAVCEDKDAPASARVAAAKAILDGAVKAVELQDLTARIEALETARSGQ